jgi:hypothetical protein
VPDLHQENDQSIVLCLVEDPVIADPQAKDTVRTFEGLDATGTRILLQSIDFRGERRRISGGKARNPSPRGA